jgi:branched-chain amino acid transport system ATP-binding protein
MGPNGTGKSTLAKAIAGHPDYTITSGDVLLEGKSLKGQKQHQITRLGLARTFQNIRLFGEMSALANVVVSSECPLAVGCSASFQNPSTHLPWPSSTAPRKLTLGTSQPLLIWRFMRRVYSYSTAVKSLRV